MSSAVSPLRVLVGDDDRASRAVVVASLRGAGYEVVQAADGDAASHLQEVLADVRQLHGLDRLEHR